MADLISNGKIRVYAVPAVANTSAPTTTELNAGSRLDTIMTADGLKREIASNAIDNTYLSSLVDTEKAGTYKPDLMLTIKRQAGTDLMFALLVYQYEFFLVVRDTIDADTAWASAQAVEVYPVQCGQRGKLYGPNTNQRYDVKLFCHTPPALSAAVA